MHVELSPTFYHCSYNNGRVCLLLTVMHVPLITEPTYTYMVTVQMYMCSHDIIYVWGQTGGGCSFGIPVEGGV